MLKDAPIVILDEATADLDSTTEAALWSALEPWLAGKTVLIISHRPTIVAHVDRVVGGGSEFDGHDNVIGLHVAASPRGHPFSRTDRAYSRSSFGIRRRAPMATGSVKKLVSDRGFGFIAADDGKEYFFHRNELESSSDFDRLVGGEKVEFEIGQSPKGPQAQKVRLV